MNLPFTHEQLYPSAYEGIPLSPGWAVQVFVSDECGPDTEPKVVLDDNADRSKCTVVNAGSDASVGTYGPAGNAKTSEPIVALTSVDLAIAYGAGPRKAAIAAIKECRTAVVDNSDKDGALADIDALLGSVMTDPGTIPQPEPKVDLADCQGKMVDAWLDALLDFAGIEFSSPNQMVHYLDYSTLLVLVTSYHNKYISQRTGHLVGGMPVDDMTDEQLRKLALWLYDQLGGTECE